MIASHAGAYYNFSETDLVAVSDLNENKLNKCSKKWKIKSLYQNYKEMLENEKLDIVSVCTWPSTHYDIIKEITNHNIKAIYCEKPISDNLEKAYKIVKLCKEKNIILQINHQRRFCPFHQQIKLFLQSKELGDIQHVSAYYTAGVNNTGSHLFDLLRFFFGDVSWIYSLKSENKSQIKNDINIDGILKFKNNIFCAAHACDVDDFLIFEIDIIGTKGRLRLIDSGFNVDFYVVENSKYFSGYNELVKSDFPIDKTIKREFMINGVKHLVSCVKNNSQSISSGKDGLKTFEIISAFHKSVNTNQKIFLPLLTNQKIFSDNNIELKKEVFFCISCKKQISLGEVELRDGFCQTCYHERCNKWKEQIG